MLLLLPILLPQREEEEEEEEEPDMRRSAFITEPNLGPNSQSGWLPWRIVEIIRRNL